MPRDHLRGVIEALLLAADDPIPFDRFTQVLPEVPPDEIRDVLDTLQLELAGPHRGIHLSRIAGGYQLRTNPEMGPHIRDFFASKPVRLSRPAMETLAIIAYRQPVTRAAIEDIRGVSCTGVLQTLQEVQLVAVIGQLDDIGRPNLYGTTPRFLEFFGLEDLDQLPTPDSADWTDLITDPTAEEPDPQQ